MFACLCSTEYIFQCADVARQLIQGLMMWHREPAVARADSLSNSLDIYHGSPDSDDLWYKSTTSVTPNGQSDVARQLIQGLMMGHR